MNNPKMFDAMSQIDEKIIDRCAKRKNDVQSSTASKIVSVNHKFSHRKMILAAVSLILIAVVSLSAIIMAHYSNKKANQDLTMGQVLKIGFDPVKDESPHGARIAIMSDKEKIAVGEDLPVSIYSVCNSKDDKTPTAVTAKIMMSYSRIDHNNMIETVKVIGDGTTPDYTWSGSLGQMKSEDMIVPAAVFTKAETTEASEDPAETDGVVVWALEVNKTFADGSFSTDKDSAALYYKIENNEVYLKPSDETTELVKTAVEKLRQGVVFLPGVSSNLTHTLMDEYEYTAKWVAPELITLETKDDTAIALIELYEAVLKEYSTCDLDGYYDFQIKTTEFLEQHAPYPVAQIQYSEANLKIRNLQGARMVIEALLALDRYYDQLGEQNVQRMMNDFAEYASIDYASASKFYDDVSNETMFEMYRSGRYGGLIIID